MNKFKTPLHIACGRESDGEVAKLLLAAGADMAARDIDGHPPLHSGGPDSQRKARRFAAPSGAI